MIRLESTLTATLVDHMGDDSSVVAAARVSVGSKSDDLGNKDLGLINFLAREGHTSPFEHVTVTFVIDAPIFVAREWMRHRTQSFNEVSGRYKVLEDRFYAPDIERPLVQEGKPGAYTYVTGDKRMHVELMDAFNEACHMSWVQYQYLLTCGVAKEVARMVLPVNTYTQWYATANLLNWVKFLKLRTAPNAMFEIRELAGQVQTQLFNLAPFSMAAWL